MFGRRIQNKEYTFGVSGLLRQSNLVMYDRETESWWQQGTFEAIVGELAGTKLEVLPSALASWKDFKATYPKGLVLSRDTGATRPYGLNPYEFYDQASSPFLFEGEVDKRLPAMERVVGIGRLGAKSKVYPFSVLAEQRVVYDRVGDQEVVILFKPGTRTAVGNPVIARARDVGTAAVYSPLLEGRRLTLRPRGDLFEDAETGSLWSIFGQAVSGPLRGKRLTPVFHTQSFWFYERVIRPDVEIYSP